MLNNLIYIDGYMVFRTDQMSKGKSEFNTSEILSITKAKHFELFAVKVNVL